MENLNLSSKIDLEILRKEIEAAVQSVATKYNLKMQGGGISYTALGSCSVKVEVQQIEKPKGVIEAQEKLMAQYGLPGLLGKQFTAKGKGKKMETFIIAGIDPGCHKNPVKLDRPNQQSAKCSVEYVKFQLGLNSHIVGTLTKVDTNANLKSTVLKALKRNEQVIRSAVNTLGTYDPNEILYMFEESLYGGEVKPIVDFLNHIHSNNKGFGHNYLEVITKYVNDLK